TGVDPLACGYPEPSVAAAADREDESRGAPDSGAVLVVGGVLPADVAMTAPFADLAASVPRVPRDGHDPSVEFHAQPDHVAAFDTVFDDGFRVVLAEIVAFDAAADESAALVKGERPRARVARADFEDAEAGLAGRGDGVGEQ